MLKKSTIYAPIFLVITLALDSCGTASHEKTEPTKAAQAIANEPAKPEPPMNQPSQIPATPVQATPAAPVVPNTPPSAPAAPTASLNQGNPAVMVAPSTELNIVISGNGSCDSNDRSPYFPGLVMNSFFYGFTKFILNAGLIQPGSEILFVCYDEFSPIMNFYSSLSPQAMHPIHEAQLDSLLLSRAQNRHKIRILGYSYGGWRAIKLASSLALIAQSSTLSIDLITMDPISKVTCQGAFDAGCRNAPRDLSPNELSLLNHRTRWLNIFQRAALFIGSGAIPGAQTNIEFPGTHLNLPKQPRAWSPIQAFIAS